MSLLTDSLLSDMQSAADQLAALDRFYARMPEDAGAELRGEARRREEKIRPILDRILDAQPDLAVSVLVEEAVRLSESPSGYAPGFVFLGAALRKLADGEKFGRYA